MALALLAIGTGLPVGASGCTSSPVPPSSTVASDLRPPPQTFQLTVTAVDTTFVTRDHFIASVEMQISGEPFAEAMGRDLSCFSRDFACQSTSPPGLPCSPSQYFDPALNGGVSGGSNGRIDLPGFASAGHARGGVTLGWPIDARGRVVEDALEPLEDGECAVPVRCHSRRELRHEQSADRRRVRKRGASAVRDLRIGRVRRNTNLVCSRRRAANRKPGNPPDQGRGSGGVRHLPGKATPAPKD